MKLRDAEIRSVLHIQLAAELAGHTPRMLTMGEGRRAREAAIPMTSVRIHMVILKTRKWIERVRSRARGRGGS